MKKTLVALIGLLLIAVIAVSHADDKTAAERPWFDTKNCAFCSQLAAQPGLLEHMRNNYHNVSTGIMLVSEVPAEYQDAFKKAMEGMKPIIAGIQQGKMPTMCQHCEMLGKISMNPAIKQDMVKTDFGSISLYTSTDSASVAMMQSFATRSNEETAKAIAMMKAEKK